MDDLSRHVLTALGATSAPPSSPLRTSENQTLAALLLAHGLLGFYGKKHPEVPVEIRKALEAQWAVSLRLAKVQDDVTRALAAAGIAFFVLKGSPLSERLYGDALLRPSGDVDVLIEPSRWETARRALTAAGFRESGGKENHFHGAFESADRLGTLELHHDLSDGRFAFPLADLFARGRMQAVSGRNLLIMHPQDELLYLVAHHATHYLLGRFFWLMDVAFFVERFGGEIAWQELEDRVRRWRLGNAVWASLTWAQHFFGDRWSRASREAIGKLVDRLRPSLATRQILEMLASKRSPFSAAVHTSAWAGRLAALALMDGATSRARQMWIRTGWVGKTKSQT